MQYLLSVHHTAGDAFPSEEVMQKMYADVEAFNKEVQENGVWVFANGLQGPETAKAVDSNSGEVVITDGPVAKCETQIGGFWVIEVDSDEKAYEYAAKASKCILGPVEVRPFQAIPVEASLEG